MTALWSEFASKPPYVRSRVMGKSSQCIFNEEIVCLVSIWVSPWIFIMVIVISYSLGGSAKGSMTHLMVEHCVGKYHVMFFGIFEKAPTICVESSLSIFTYFLGYSVFPVSLFALKSPVVIIICLLFFILLVLSLKFL